MDSKRAKEPNARPVTESFASLGEGLHGCGDKIIEELKPAIKVFAKNHPSDWVAFKVELADALYNSHARENVRRAWGIDPAPPKFH